MAPVTPKALVILCALLCACSSTPTAPPSNGGELRLGGSRQDPPKLPALTPTAPDEAPAGARLRFGEAGSHYSALLRDVDASPRHDWTIAATASGVCLWSLETGQRLGCPIDGDVHSIDVSGNGRWLAVAFNDRRVGLWDLDRRRWKKLFELPSSSSDRTIRVATSSNGELIAAHDGQEAFLWMVETERLQKVHQSTQFLSPLLAFSQNNQKLFFMEPEAIKAYDVAQKITRRVSHLPSSSSANAIALSASRDVLYRCEDSLDVVAYSLKDATHRTIAATSAPCHLLGVTAKGRIFAVSQGEVEVWDPETGEQTHRGHLQNSEDIHALSASPSIPYVLGVDLYHVTRWDPESFEAQGTSTHHTSEISDIVFSKDGAWVASADFSGALKLWSPDTGALLAARAFDAPIQSIELSPQGRRVTVVLDDRVLIWSLPSDPTALADALKKNAEAEIRVKEKVQTAHFLKDDQLVIADRAGGLEFWHTPTLTRWLSLHTPRRSPVLAIASSPDAQQLWTLDSTFHLRTWDPYRGSQLALPYVVGYGDVNGLAVMAFNPETLRLSLATSYGYLRSLTRSGLKWSSPILDDALKAHSDISALTLNTRHHQLVFLDDQRSASVIDLQQRTEKKSLPFKKTPRVSRLAISPDGRFLVSGDEGGDLFLWPLN